MSQEPAAIVAQALYAMALSDDGQNAIIYFQFDDAQLKVAFPAAQLPGVAALMLQKQDEADRQKGEPIFRPFDVADWDVSEVRDGHVVLIFELPNGGRLSFRLVPSRAEAFSQAIKKAARAQARRAAPDLATDAPLLSLKEPEHLGANNSLGARLSIVRDVAPDAELTESFKLDSEIGSEVLTPSFSYTWVDPIPIAAGEVLAPARISSPDGRKFAALHLILGDLTFAHDCLAAADEMGLPDASNVQSKALIFSGVVAYGRAFKSGVRALKLSSQYVRDLLPVFDSDMHDYLIALRDKHVAHPVNEFEFCETVALIVGNPDTGAWRCGGAIGVTETQSVGLSRPLLRHSIVHIQAMIEALKTAVERDRISLNDGFKGGFERGEKWEMAPIARFPDLAKVEKRRK